jgi:hypothetical protein
MFGALALRQQSRIGSERPDRTHDRERRPP